MEKTLKFETKSVQHAEEHYKTIHIAPEQTQIIGALTQLLSQYLPIPERAIKGFIWRVLKEYQMYHQTDLSEGVKGSNITTPAERVKELQVIFSLLKKELTRILIDKEQEPLLDDTFEKVVNFYKEKFANR